MSKKNLMIVLSPNVCFSQTEIIKADGFICPMCAGQGAFMIYDNSEDERICEHCEGTGKLKAEVQIIWKPDL